MKIGDIVRLKPEVEKEWEKAGEFEYGGWILRGEHVITSIQGSTVYTQEGAGFHNANEVLEIVKR